MCRYYVGFALLLVVVLAGVLGGHVISGGDQSIYPIAQGFTDHCSPNAFPACWNGITLGEITVRGASYILESLGYSFLEEGENMYGYFYAYQGDQCTVRLYSSAEDVERIEILDCQSLTVGNIIEAFGEPISLHFFEDGHGTLTYLDMGMEVDFSDGLRSDSPVDLIAIYRLEGSGAGAFEWYGYGTYEDYCGFEPFRCEP